MLRERERERLPTLSLIPHLTPAVQAVRLKEKQLASEVIAVSCGPQACQVSEHTTQAHPHGCGCCVWRHLDTCVDLWDMHYVATGVECTIGVVVLHGMTTVACMQ